MTDFGWFYTRKTWKTANFGIFDNKNCHKSAIFQVVKNSELQIVSLYSRMLWCKFQQNQTKIATPDTFWVKYPIFQIFSISDIIQQYSTIYGIIWQYSAFFDNFWKSYNIQHHSTLFNAIWHISTVEYVEKCRSPRFLLSNYVADLVKSHSPLWRGDFFWVLQKHYAAIFEIWFFANFQGVILTKFWTLTLWKIVKIQVLPITKKTSKIILSFWC